MNAHADRTQENKSHTIVNDASKKQPVSDSAFQFVDNRPAAIAQRKLQEIVNNSPQVKQLMAFQEMANNSSGIYQFMAAGVQKHTFKGDRNKRLSGFHSKADEDGAELKGVASKTTLGSHGAYKQKVEDAKFDSPPDKKTKKGGESTFFPDEMSKSDVIAAVDTAEGGLVKATGKAWDGMSIHIGTGAFPKD